MKQLSERRSDESEASRCLTGTGTGDSEKKKKKKDAQGVTFGCIDMETGRARGMC